MTRSPWEVADIIRRAGDKFFQRYRRFVPSLFAVVGRLLALEFVEECELGAGDVLYSLAEASDVIELSGGRDEEYLFSGMAPATPREFPSANWSVPLTLSAIDLGMSSYWVARS